MQESDEEDEDEVDQELDNDIMLSRGASTDIKSQEVSR